MPKERIAIIGGASPFVPSLIHVILENKEALDQSRVCLMDIDAERLPKLAELGEGLARRQEADIRFSFTTDPQRALDGATFVLLGYRVGGLAHMRFDIEIPTRHGFCGDETAGPGGSFMALCTIPTTLDYCRMIQKLCPDATVISYVNPAGFVADAVRRETDVEFISLCDCFAGFSMEFLPEALKMPPFDRRYCVSADIKPRAMGVNHLTWLTELEVNGQDGYPLLTERIAQHRGDTAHDRPLDLMVRLLDIYGYVNICPYHVRPYFDNREFLRERMDQGANREAEVLGWSPARWAFVEALLAGASYEDHPPEYCFARYHSRHAVGILVSIATDEGREWGGINFPNEGAIANLPRGAIVEGTCSVDRAGLTPIAQGKLPKPFVGLTCQLINWQELTVDAALSGDKKTLHQALLACPYVHDIRGAKAMTDELLEAHAEIVGQLWGD